MWEGIGIVSFLLISFWYTRIPAVKAGVQALVVNRVGDMMLSVGLFAMFYLFGNLDYGTVFTLTPYFNEISITIIGLLLFIGATAKSAQIPLHIWLPASMEGNVIITINLILLLNYIFIINFSYFYDFINLDTLLSFTFTITTFRERDEKGRFKSVKKEITAWLRSRQPYLKI